MTARAGISGRTVVATLPTVAMTSPTTNLEMNGTRYRVQAVAVHGGTTRSSGTTVSFTTKREE